MPYPTGYDLPIYIHFEAFSLGGEPMHSDLTMARHTCRVTSSASAALEPMAAPGLAAASRHTDGVGDERGVSGCPPGRGERACAAALRQEHERLPFGARQEHERLPSGARRKA